MKTSRWTVWLQMSAALLWKQTDKPPMQRNRATRRQPKDNSRSTEDHSGSSLPSTAANGPPMHSTVSLHDITLLNSRHTSAYLHTCLFMLLVIPLHISRLASSYFCLPQDIPLHTTSYILVVPLHTSSYLFIPFVVPLHTDSHTSAYFFMPLLMHLHTSRHTYRHTFACICLPLDYL